MKKAEKILEKHIVLNDCIGYLGRDGRLYKAIIDAIEEAINYTRCCKSDSELLPDANKHQCNCSNAKDRLDCGFECYNK